MESDISGFGKTAKDLSRNPLGIIALFIVLIYGFAALLLSKTAGTLPPDQTAVLVYFLAIFPVIVLMTFAWLVAKHHAKLYGPGDYKSDAAFLQTLTPAERQLYREREIEAASQLEAPPIPLAHTAAVAPPDTGRGLPDLRAAYTRAEDLVFQHLEKEYTGKLTREVKVHGTGDYGIFDGVLTRDSGITLIEVKFTRSAFMPGMVWREVLYRALIAAQKAKQLSPPIDIDLLIVIVADVSPEDRERLSQRVSKQIKDAPIPVQVRFYTTKELEQ